MEIYYNRIPKSDTSYWLGIIVRWWVYFSFSFGKLTLNPNAMVLVRTTKEVVLRLISYYSIQKGTC